MEPFFFGSPFVAEQSLELLVLAAPSHTPEMPQHHSLTHTNSRFCPWLLLYTLTSQSRKAVSLFFVILVAGYQAGMYLGWVHEQNLTLVPYAQEYVTTIFSWTQCIIVVVYVFLMTRYSAKIANKSSQSDRRSDAFHQGQDAVGFRFFFFARHSKSN